MRIGAYCWLPNHWHFVAWPEHDGDLSRFMQMLPQLSDWMEHVNAPQTEAELQAIRRSVRRGSPYGSAFWTEQTAKQLGLEPTLRVRGRPRGQSP